MQVEIISNLNSLTHELMNFKTDDEYIRFDISIHTLSAFNYLWRHYSVYERKTK